jgi:hypothetical protein
MGKSNLEDCKFIKVFWYYLSNVVYFECKLKWCCFILYFLHMLHNQIIFDIYRLEKSFYKLDMKKLTKLWRRK